MEVLGRLDEARLKAMCLFTVDEVSYMLNERGQRPIPEKTEAVLSAPAPTNIPEV